MFPRFALGANLLFPVEVNAEEALGASYKVRVVPVVLNGAAHSMC